MTTLKMPWFIKNGLPTTCIVLLLAAYVVFVRTYATNLPQEDDIPALLGFVLTYHPDSVLDALAILRRHNEHVITWARLAAWLVVQAEQGPRLIGLLVIIGQFWLLGLAWQLGRLLPKGAQNVWLAVPLVALVFNAQHQITTLWALGLWSNVIILVLAFSCFHYLGTRRFALASLLAFAATVANGNGILVFGVGTILLLFYAPANKKGWAIWLGFFVLGGLALRYALAGPSIQTFQVFTPHRVPVCLMGFLGSACALVGGKIDVAASVVVGLGVLVVGGWYVWSTLLQRRKGLSPSAKTVALVGLLGFIVATALVVAIFRSEKGVEVIIGSRYRHYSCIALAVVFLMLMDLLPARRNLITFVFSILGLAIAFISYPRQISYRLPFVWRLQADAQNLATTQNFPQLIVSGFDTTYANAIQAGIQEAPAPLAASLFASLPTKATYKEEDKGPDLYICRQLYTLQTDRLRLRAHPDSGTFCALLQVAGRDTVLFPAEGKRSYIAWLLQKPEVYVPGAKANVYTCGLHGRYAVAWLQGRRLYPTADTLALP